MEFRRSSLTGVALFASLLTLLLAGSAFARVLGAAETLKAPSVTTQPKSASVSAGTPVSFTSAASGNPVPTVQWQVSTNSGATWSNVEGATSTTYTINSPVGGQSGNLYRALFTNSQGSATSKTATLTVTEKPAVTLQPVEAVVMLGESAKFQSAATGAPAPTVQWQRSTDGGKTWTAITGATSATLTLGKYEVAGAPGGSQYRAVWKNNVGEAISNAALLVVERAPFYFSVEPLPVTVEAGSPASFSAECDGYPEPTVQWQVSTDHGSTWSSVDGATNRTLVLNSVTGSMSGYEYRAVFTNVLGSATSSSATLTVLEVPSVTEQPGAASVEEGESVSFTAAATGSPSPSAQWEVSTNGGGKWTPITGATSTTLTLSSVTVGQDGYQYRARFTNVAGTTTSSGAQLSVHRAPYITSQPTAAVVNAGQNAVFEAAGSGYPAPSVQWQKSTDGGATWTSIEGATGTKLTLTAVGAEANGSLYRAVFTNAFGSATSNAAALTVYTPPVITRQPEWQTVLTGEEASFTADASAFPAPTVQWERSTDGGATWTAIAGATQKTYAIGAAGASQNGELVRATFTNAAGRTATNSAKLTVTSTRYQAVSWGLNSFRQLGNGQSNYSSDLPAIVAKLNFVKAVAAGTRNGAALLEDGTVRTWGTNENGELGTGSESEGISSTPVAVSGLTEVKAIAVGGEHMLALRQDGTVVAWGDGEQGQLGDGSNANQRSPVQVSGLSNVVAIAAAGNVSMALLQNGTVKTWGENTLGQLGIGKDSAESNKPVTVGGVSGASAISAGPEFELAVAGGKVWAWGSERYGELGTNGPEETENEASPTPVEVAGLSGITQVAAGVSHALALGSNGNVYAWGRNAEGELGNGTKGGFSAKPAAVPGLGEAAAVAAGNQYSLALLKSGHLCSWGSNANGVLGNGTYGESTSAPAAVAGLGEVRFIAAGEGFAIADGEPLPVVTGLSPNAGPLAGGTEVHIAGVNLGGVTSVKFGGTPALGFTVNSNTSITAQAPAGSGTVEVHLGSAAGTSPTEAAAAFTYQPPPQVLHVSLKTLEAKGGQTVTITGRNLTMVQGVALGGVPASEFHATGEQITAVLPAHTAGTFYLTVTTAGGTSGAEESGGKLKIVPSVTGLSPSTGPLAGGTTITIDGYGFVPGANTASVKIGRKSATSVQCESQTTCTAVVPGQAAGEYQVQVKVNKAKSPLTPADIFTYAP